MAANPWARKLVRIIDPERLEAAAGFDPGYLPLRARAAPAHGKPSR
jgi:hypothetical protein